jgi:hypothetical protein
MFAALIPRNGPRVRFVVGIPYSFFTDSKHLYGHPIYLITSKLDSITPQFDGESHRQKPYVRGFFTGPDKGKLTFNLIECGIYATSPTIKIFADQITHLTHFRTGVKGDFLLGLRAGKDKNGALIPCVSELHSTITLGDISRVVVRDTPPFEFVSDLCVKLGVQVLFGGDDYDGKLPVPVISNKDILTYGGVSHFYEGEAFHNAIFQILSHKYREDNTPPEVFKKVFSLLQNECVRDTGRCTLIWANQHEELSLKTAHRLARILTDYDTLPMRPKVITTANGLSYGASNEDVMELNTELFPAMTYDRVIVVDKVVAVLNDNIRGNNRSSFGVDNTVRYLIGHPRYVPKEPWVFTQLTPPVTVLSVEGTRDRGREAGSDDKHTPDSSYIITVQAKFCKQIMTDIESHSFGTCGLVRATSPGRWSVISFFPFLNFNVDDLKNCIAKYNYIYLVPSSLTTRGSHNPGMGLLKVVGNYAYKKNIPVFIDLLTKFKTSRSPQMVFSRLVSYL